MLLLLLLLLLLELELLSGSVSASICLERRDGVACDVVARSTVLSVLELDDEVCLSLSVGRHGN